MKRRNVSPAERASMRKMREAGSSVAAIMDAHPRWTYSTIHRHTGDIKGETRTGNRRVDPAAAIRLRDDNGLWWSDIGARFGVSKAAAYQAVKRERARREDRA